MITIQSYCICNIPGIGSGLRLTPQAVAGIYLGKITRWNDPTLARLNQKLKLPEQDIVVVHRSDGSGTTSIFTDYLSSVDAVWAKRVGKGTSVAWPTGVGAKGSSEVVNRIKGTPYSIGYAEIAYAIENDLSTAVLKNRSGQFVKPNMFSTRAAAVHAMEGGDRGILDQVQDELVEKDYRISLVNKPGRDVYPIVGLTWLLVYQQQEDAVKGKKLVEFGMTWPSPSGGTAVKVTINPAYLSPPSPCGRGLGGGGKCHILLRWQLHHPPPSSRLRAEALQRAGPSREGEPTSCCALIL